MFAILWFLFVAFFISISLVWILDHQGFVVINWLGFQLQTDILTAILLMIFFTVFTVFIAYILTRLLAIKFPNLLKLFFKKNYTKRLEKLVYRHHQAFEIMSQLMLALEVGNEKLAQELHKKFAKLIKNPALNNFFLGKIFFEKEDFTKAAEFFAKFGENHNAKILVLKSKFKLALVNQDETSAIAYAKQILSVKKHDFDTAKILFALYKKGGLWREAKYLIAEYDSKHFKDELQKRDIALINTALASESYQKKNFSEAIKYAKIALKAENNFLPAFEIMLKSWIKRGFAFKARWMIKNLWRENPNLILAEIFDLTNRKSSKKSRIKAMKKLAALNSESALGNVASGQVAYKVGEYRIAKELLNLSLTQTRTNRAYKLLAFIEKAENNIDGYRKNLAKAKMLEQDDRYICNSCTTITSKWSAKCDFCGSYDSLEWSN